MSQSIYDVTVPTFIRALNCLAAVLDKGRAHAESEKIDPAVLLTMRLYPDMFPLTRQVQIASDNAKGCVARLAQQEPPKYEDGEASFADLRVRLENTVGYLKSVSPRSLEGAGERPVVLKFPHRTLNFASGWEYLLAFALPNVYFHCTTAYDILRHSGVRVGKGDFLGAVG
jgi:uncharacterized protein